MGIRLERNRASSSSAKGLRPKQKFGFGSKAFGFLFGLPFFALGSFFFWIGGLHPLLKVIGSNDWPEVPCVITHSEVDANHGGDSTTYSVDIQFRYTYGNREYNGGSYVFSTGSSSGRGG